MNTSRPIVVRATLTGSLASLLSAVVLAWRGRVENASAAAPLNAPSHWFFGRHSLHRNDTSWRYTATGFATHHASSIFWAAFYELLLARHHKVTPVKAIADATVITAVSAAVDLKLVPQRLTPGFERRLSRASLAAVYVAFGIGLAVAGCLRRR